MSEIKNESYLLQSFLSGIKPRKANCIGAEVELFVVDPGTFRAVAYEGETGVAAILGELGRSFAWTPVLEKDSIIGLTRGKEAVTIEPGGQIEFGTAPLASVAEIEKSVAAFLTEMHTVCSSFARDVLLCGRLPFDSVESVALVPKSRYTVMYGYMPAVGERGREMMKLTTALQCAIDYQSEADAIQKFKLASLLTPYLIALSANSAIKEGSFSGYASDRGAIWLETDAARCGLPPLVFKEDAGFSDYAAWALDAPVYFIERNQTKYPATGYRFRELLEGKLELPAAAGFDGVGAEDWQGHLSTLFPWVRLRSYIEIRAFDMNPPEVIYALLALVQGIFYDDQAAAEAFQLVRASEAEFGELLELAIVKGLDGKRGEISIRERSATLLKIAADGLARYKPEELPYLAPLIKRVDSWSLENTKEEASAPHAMLQSRLLSSNLR